MSIHHTLVPMFPNQQFLNSHHHFLTPSEPQFCQQQLGVQQAFLSYCWLLSTLFITSTYAASSSCSIASLPELVLLGLQSCQTLARQVWDILMLFLFTIGHRSLPFAIPSLPRWLLYSENTFCIRPLTILLITCANIDLSGWVSNLIC